MPILANGQPVIACRLVRPRIGAWWADLSIATSDAITGAVTLAIEDGATLTGTVVPTRSRVFLDTFHCRVVGGAGGLSSSAAPRFYQQIPGRNVIGDILGAGGESLSSTSTAATLSTQLAFWSIGAVSVGTALAAIVGQLGAIWRVLDDGSVFVGSEAWSTADPDRVLLAETPTEDRVTYGVAVAGGLMPGTVIDGRRVSRVEDIMEEARIRSIAWLEAA